jgi:hypothetical protein
MWVSFSRWVSHLGDECQKLSHYPEKYFPTIALLHILIKLTNQFDSAGPATAVRRRTAGQEIPCVY